MTSSQKRCIPFMTNDDIIDGSNFVH